jgi:hypothetical protein
MVIFNRNSPSDWSKFVDTGKHIKAGQVGIVVNQYTTTVKESARVTVYRVFVAGQIVNAWEDELITSAEQFPTSQ